jgi:hypothetical protein
VLGTRRQQAKVGVLGTEIVWGQSIILSAVELSLRATGQLHKSEEINRQTLLIMIRRWRYGGKQNYGQGKALADLEWRSQV